MTAALNVRWTVASLAKVAGMSRAAYARRFAFDVGTTPLKYLAELRLSRAAKLFVEVDASLGVAAQAIGYESEFALSRAFKRKFGEAPASFRRRHRPVSTTIRAAA